MIYAKNLPHNSPATCLRGIADDLRQRMRQNRKRLPRAGLLQEKRQIERAAETESVPAHARGIGQGHVGEALEQHGQQDDANGSPRQVHARAMMRAVAKCPVRTGLAQPVVVSRHLQARAVHRRGSGDSPLVARDSFTVLGKAT